MKHSNNNKLDAIAIDDIESMQIEHCFLSYVASSQFIVIACGRKSEQGWTIFIEESYVLLVDAHSHLFDYQKSAGMNLENEMRKWELRKVLNSMIPNEHILD